MFDLWQNAFFKGDTFRLSVCSTTVYVFINYYMKGVKINNNMCNIFDHSFWVAREMPFILTIIAIIAHFHY